MLSARVTTTALQLLLSLSRAFATQQSSFQSILFVERFIVTLSKLLLLVTIDTFPRFAVLKHVPESDSERENEV